MFYLFDNEDTLIDTFASEEEVTDYLKDECCENDVDGYYVIEGTKYLVDETASYELVEE